jgi:uncharacterized protein (TIGR00288 family)
MEREDKKIALLIDADNISAKKYVDNIFTELTKYGKVTIRHMYGDWSVDRLKKWLAYSAKYSLVPVMQLNDTPGKNASDIGLIIEAMDFLYTEDVDIFCIVSSDGDFNRLAKRIRESGKTVIGMGEKKTPEAFRNSCERFIFLDIENEEQADSDDDNDRNHNGHGSRTDKDMGDEKGSTKKEDIVKAINKILSEDDASENIKIGLGELGSRLNKIFPDFDPRNYGYSKLSTFVREFKDFNVTNDNKWVSLYVTSVCELDRTVMNILAASKDKAMNMGELKKNVLLEIKDLDACVAQTGVTKFSTFLKKSSYVEVDDNMAKLLD